VLHWSPLWRCPSQRVKESKGDRTKENHLFASFGANAAQGKNDGDCVLWKIGRFELGGNSRIQNV
jgi:hypothetical protein